MRIKPKKENEIFGGSAVFSGDIGTVCANPITLTLLLIIGTITFLMSESNARVRDLEHVRVDPASHRSMPLVCVDRKIKDWVMQLVYIVCFALGVYFTLHV